MVLFYQRANMFMLLCGTLTSEYVLRCYMLLLQANMATLVYGILSQAIMFARLYGIFCQRICSRCYAFLLLVLFMLLARSGLPAVRLPQKCFEIRQAIRQRAVNRG